MNRHISSGIGALAVGLGILLLIFGGEKNKGYGIRFLVTGTIVAVVSRRKALPRNITQGPS